MPSAGSASSSSPLARSTASSDPIRDRWTGWTAVTTPIDGRAIAASSAISPPTYIPISRTAASCSGPSRSSVSGSPISLFMLPSVRRVRRAAPRTAAAASFVEVLAMLPVMPTTSGVNRRRQPAATAPRAACPSATRTTVTSPRAAASLGGRVTSTAAAPRRDRLGQVVVAVGALAGERDEELARRDQPRIDGAAADRSGRAGQQPAAGEAEEVVGREGGRRGVGRRRGRRVDVGHARQCRIAAAHRSAALGVMVDGPIGQQVGRRDRVGGDAAEQLERHHGHLQPADTGDRRRALLDADGDHEVRRRRSRAPMYPTNE